MNEVFQVKLIGSEEFIKITQRLQAINNFRYANDTTLMAESKEELKNLLMRVKEESEKASLKLNLKKTDHGILSPHFTQTEGENIEAVTDILFLSSKITADGDCRQEVRGRLLLGKKAMTVQTVLIKSKDITLPTKVRIIKAMVFPVVMYGCESWTIKKVVCMLNHFSHVRSLRPFGV